MNYGTNKVKVSYFVELPQSHFPTTQISRPFSDFGPFPLTLAEFHEISRYTEIPEKWRPCVLQTIKWWLLWHTGNDIGHADKLHRAQLVLGLATVGGSAIPIFIQATQPLWVCAMSTGVGFGPCWEKNGKFCVVAGLHQDCWHTGLQRYFEVFSFRHWRPIQDSWSAFCQQTLL